MGKRSKSKTQSEVLNEIIAKSSYALTAYLKRDKKDNTLEKGVLVTKVVYNKVTLDFDQIPVSQYFGEEAETLIQLLRLEVREGEMADEPERRHHDETHEERN